MKTQTIGVEIEMTGITRAKAAEVTSNFIGGTVKRTFDNYDTYNVTAPDSRVWKIMSDASILTMKKEKDTLVEAGKSYSVELVTPILKYDEDIETLQELVRQLRHAGAVSESKLNGYRRYNSAYVEIPKKNGKSELAAALALYLTCGDNEWGAEVYGCEADRQHASIVFDVAVDMVDQCPALKKRIKPILSQKRLVYMPLGSFYQVLSAEVFTKHGLNVHGVIFDELHAQPNRELYNVMTKGSGDARTQPLFFLITTAGTDRNSICYEVHQKSEDIIRGKKVDNTFYPVKILAINGINIDVSKYKNLKLDKFNFKNIEEKPLGNSLGTLNTEENKNTEILKAKLALECEL